MLSGPQSRNQSDRPPGERRLSTASALAPTKRCRQGIFNFTPWQMGQIGDIRT